MKSPATLIVIAAAVVLVGVPAATAAHRPGQTERLARLARANRLLHKRLSTMTTAKKAVSAQLDETRSQFGTFRSQSQGAALQAQSQAAALQSQIAVLQATLTRRTTERDGARAQAARLQAELDAIPAPLAVAVEEVRREVAWAQHGTDGSTWAPHGPSAYSLGQLTAVSALNYVVGHVSAGAYGYLQTTRGHLPAATPDSVLAAQAGFCGDAALTFAAIVKRFGYPVRSVQFYFTTPGGAPDDHIAAEVFYDGGWHFFDPTFGVYWTDPAGNVLSIDDARHGAGVEQKDLASFINLTEDPWFNEDDTAFETDPATVVAIDQQQFNG